MEKYSVSGDLSVGNKQYEKGKTCVVRTDQTQYRMIRTMFEKVTQFSDSIFYDASTWTMTLAYNMPYDALNASIKFSKGERLKQTDLTPTPAPVTKSNYAYIIDWSDYNAPRMLYLLQSAKIFAKTAFKPFAAIINTSKKNFGYGTLMIPVADQQ